MGVLRTGESIKLRTGLVIVAESEDVQETIRNKSIDELTPHFRSLTVSIVD